MARIHGKDLTAVSVDDSGGSARALVAETLSVSFPQITETHDTHTMGDDWKEVTGGLKGGGDISHEFFYNNTANNTDHVYSGRVGVEGTFTLTEGTVTYACETVVTDYTIEAAVGDMVKGTATHRQTGAITRS